MINSLNERLIFWKNADRIGPDIPLTYWMLFFKSKMKKLCKRKFFHFSETAEIRPGAYIVGCSKISIGENIVIRPNVQMHGETNTLDVSIVIEDNVLIGSGVHFYVENHSFENPNIDIIYQGHSKAKPILLKKGCWIGANVIILPGVTVGKNAVVGAGSVVTKSVDDFSVVAGIPAKLIKRTKNS